MNKGWLQGVCLLGTMLLATRAEARFLQTDPIGYKDNLDLYEYVGDDPVDHIDPTGTEIVVQDPKQQAQILPMINSQTTTQYKFDKNGKLQVDTSKGSNAKGSSYYAKKVTAGINSKSVTFTMAISATAPAEIHSGSGKSLGTRPADVQSEFGGGTTSTDGHHIWISGQSYMDKDSKHQPLVASPADILKHEYVGHAFPRVFGGGTGNAVEDENKARGQLGEPLRESDPDHRE